MRLRTITIALAALVGLLGIYAREAHAKRHRSASLFAITPIAIPELVAVRLDLGAPDWISDGRSFRRTTQHNRLTRKMTVKIAPRGAEVMLEIAAKRGVRLRTAIRYSVISANLLLVETRQLEPEYQFVPSYAIENRGGARYDFSSEETGRHIQQRTDGSLELGQVALLPGPIRDVVEPELNAAGANATPPQKAPATYDKAL